MWIAKINLKHDCIIGNRCEKYNVEMQSLDLHEKPEKGEINTYSIHQLRGKEENIREFFEDLKNDRNVKYVELNERTLYLVESKKKKPVSEYMKKGIFNIKPTIIDSRGYEHWEICSHQKKELIEFMKKIKPLMDEFELLSIKNTSLKDIYFPKLMPKLTLLQKNALELAISRGYYECPKKINLRELARLSKISLATYQKHLQKAESKIIPDSISFLR